MKEELLNNKISNNENISGEDRSIRLLRLVQWGIIILWIVWTLIFLIPTPSITRTNQYEGLFYLTGVFAFLQLYLLLTSRNSSSTKHKKQIYK